VKRRVSNLLVELTNVHRLDPDALLDMCAIGVVRYFVGQHLRLAQGVHESRASSTRCTYKPHPKPKNEFRVQRKEWLDSEKKKHTNNHDGKLDTFLYLVPPASSCE
jgi:hypothetical protein